METHYKNVKQAILEHDFEYSPDTIFTFLLPVEMFDFLPEAIEAIRFLQNDKLKRYKVEIYNIIITEVKSDDIDNGVKLIHYLVRKL